jgi:ABC transporter substrate binding protein
VKRREFITLLGGAAAWPLAARAQKPERMPRIGLLLHLSPGPSTEIDAFRQGLRELGYIEGRNITIDYRFASGQVERLPELAAELVHLKPDVIVTPTTPASVAAKQATTTIPIVFAGRCRCSWRGADCQFSATGREHYGVDKCQCRVGRETAGTPQGRCPQRFARSGSLQSGRPIQCIDVEGAAERRPIIGLDASATRSARA